MNLDELREYCLTKKEVTEEFPFGEETLVFKVAGKMFALCGIYDSPLTVNLKCDPERAIELREKYNEIQPGYHMNKTHWNTVNIENILPHNLICELIDHSYELVVKGLPKAAQLKIKNEELKME